MQFDVPVIGILRGVEEAFFADVMRVSFAAGLTALEITMNTPAAVEIVKNCRPHVPEGKWLGMGTIRNLAEAEAAVDAGAMFLVSPNYDKSVIDFAGQNNVPIVAGALTPTEVYAAWMAGAAMVKVFPSTAVGPGYIKDLLGPFDDIKLAAVGGVDENNVKEYFAAGVVAVGVSATLFGKEALQNKDLELLAGNVKKFISCCQAAVKGF